MADVLTREQEAFVERLVKNTVEQVKDTNGDNQRKVKVTASVSFKPLTIHVSVEF